MAVQLVDEVPAVFGDEGPVRNRLHTHRGARLINACTRPIWRVAPPAGFGVLTTIGRRTGQPRRCCVRVVVRGPSAFVVSIVGEEVDWVRNIRANDAVHLRARGTSTSGRVRDPRDPSETAEARRAYCETRHAADFIECFLHRRGMPSRAKIRQLHERWFDQGTPLVLDLDGAPPRGAQT